MKKPKPIAYPRIRATRPMRYEYQGKGYHIGPLAVILLSPSVEMLFAFDGDRPEPITGQVTLRGSQTAGFDSGFGFRGSEAKRIAAILAPIGFRRAIQEIAP